MLAAPAEAAVVEEPPKAPTPPPPAGNANYLPLLLAWFCFEHPVKVKIKQKTNGWANQMCKNPSDGYSHNMFKMIKL